MERYLSEDEPLKKSFIVGRDSNNKKKDAADSRSLEDDKMWAELNNKRNQRQS